MKKFRRNFDKEIKAHLICGNDRRRIALSYVYFLNGYLYATNENILIKYKLEQISDFDKTEIDFLNGKFIHKTIYKKILESSFVIIKENGIISKENNTEIFYEFAKVDFKYPNCDAKIPISNEIDCDKLGFHFNYLSIISKCLPRTNTHIIKFYGNEKPVCIIPSNEDYSDCIALVMTRFI